MKTTFTTALGLAAFGLYAMTNLAGLSGCKKNDEPPPPMPSAAPVETAPPAPVVIEPPVVDAGIEDAAPDVKKVMGKPADPTGLMACCQALEQNAKSMPAPQNGYAAAAAAMCKGAIASGGGRSALSAIAGAMRGAALPPACK